MMNYFSLFFIYRNVQTWEKVAQYKIFKSSYIIYYPYQYMTGDHQLEKQSTLIYNSFEILNIQNVHSIGLNLVSEIISVHFK